MTVHQNLDALGIVLPEAAAPAANYVPYVIASNQIFISGQISVLGDDRFIGKVGKDVDTAYAINAARACAINILAQVTSAIGDLNRVTRVVRLGGFVNAIDTFTDQPKVINGASDLMVAVFGKDIGSHARAATGASSLPFDVTVEIDAIIEFA